MVYVNITGNKGHCDVLIFSMRNVYLQGNKWIIGNSKEY